MNILLLTPLDSYQGATLEFDVCKRNLSGRMLRMWIERQKNIGVEFPGFSLRWGMEMEQGSAC